MDYRPRSRSKSTPSTPGFFVGSFIVASIGRGFSIFGFPHGWTRQFDAMSVVNQTIQDAIRDSRIADLVVPMGDRHLAGEHRRANGIAIVTDFQKVAPLTVGQWSHGPIIDDQHI